MFKADIFFNMHCRPGISHLHQQHLSFLSLILLFISSMWLTGCENKSPVQTISLGAPQSMLPSLIWLTDELGYFSEQHIKLNLQPYPSGKIALYAMLDGEVDLAASAETPFAIASFKRDDLRLFATMGQSDNEVRILARRDHGINQASDLRTKTIATQQGSAVHYFLTSFLLYHQLDTTDTRIQFLKADELHLALANGDVDAISMREPYLSKARAMIEPDKLVEFGVPGLYTKTYILVGNKDFTEKYPGALQGILSALNKAAEYADKHPQKAIGIIARRLHLSRDKVVALWPKVRLSISLNQSILSTLQEEAKWVLSSGQLGDNTSAGQHIPDFLQYIDPTPLQQAIPYAVGLIGIQHKQ